MGKRRSGSAVVQFCQMIRWFPETLIVGGVGVRGTEVEVAREVWPDLMIFGVEPNPDTYQSWIHRPGGFPGVIYPCALSDRAGKATLHCRPTHKDGGSLLGLSDGNVQTHEVRTTTLADLIGAFKEPPLKEILLWLDCEGSEYQALEGLGDFFKVCPVINVEMTGRPPHPYWCSPAQVNNWLVARGYELRWVHTTRIHRGQYDAIYVHKSRNFDTGFKVW